MSLQHAAKHLAAHGRGPDTTLVHMSKEEVKSLNDLAMAHGGHLTINPHTGLPEAGFLQRLLPMVAGAAITATTGIPAWQAGLLVGGGTAAVTGNLKQGLMAGLGAYGGAGLAGSLGEAGAASVVPEATPTPAPVVDATPTWTATPAVTPPATYTSPFEGTGVNASNFARPDFVPEMEPSNFNTSVDAAGNVSQTPGIGKPPINAPVETRQLLPRVTSNTPFTSPAITPAAPAPAPVEPVGTYTGQFKTVGYGDKLAGSGLGNPPASGPVEATHPYEGAQTMSNANAATNVAYQDMTPAQRLEAMKNGLSFDNVTDWASKNKMQAYGMGASALMPWDEDQKQRTPYHDSDPGQQYTYEANAANPTPTPDPYGREQRYFTPQYVKRAANGGMMATGGISDAQYNLGGYSDGGRLLRGPGDGVSDSIPAVIGKKQPARLADGEFVVPARIVSELGNGSTEAGARKLYAMMDRIQKARGSTVGKGKVAKNSRAEKYLPA